MKPAVMLLQATCALCRMPIPQAPEAKAMCRVCSSGVSRMRQVRRDWVDEVVRRMVTR